MCRGVSVRDGVSPSRTQKGEEWKVQPQALSPLEFKTPVAEVVTKVYCCCA